MAIRRRRLTWPGGRQFPLHGANGAQGTQGAQGAQGASGAQGAQGAAATTPDSAGVGGLFIKKTALMVYDFSVDGGTVGAIVPASSATLPDNAVVTAITYDVLSTCTTAGADTGTLAISVPTDGALTTAIAVSDLSNPWDAGVHAASVITPLPKKLTAARVLGVTIGGQAFTAGKIVFAVDYYVSQ